SSRRRHTRFSRDWSSDVCSSDLEAGLVDVGSLAVTVVHAVHQASAQALELTFLQGVTDDNVGFGMVAIQRAAITHLVNDAGVQTLDTNGAEVEAVANQRYSFVRVVHRARTDHALGNDVFAA